MPPPPRLGRKAAFVRRPTWHQRDGFELAEADDAKTQAALLAAVDAAIAVAPCVLYLRHFGALREVAQGSEPRESALGETLRVGLERIRAASELVAVVAAVVPIALAGVLARSIGWVDRG